MHVPLARYDTKSEGTPVERCLLERESEVSRNVQSTEDKLLHSGTRLFDQNLFRRESASFNSILSYFLRLLFVRMIRVDKRTGYI